MIGLGGQKLARLADKCATWLEEMDGQETIGVVMIVAEIKSEEGETRFVTYCSDGRPWVQRAVLREVSEPDDDGNYGEGDE